MFFWAIFLYYILITYILYEYTWKLESNYILTSLKMKKINLAAFAIAARFWSTIAKTKFNWASQQIYKTIILLESLWCKCEFENIIPFDISSTAFVYVYVFEIISTKKIKNEKKTSFICYLWNKILILFTCTNHILYSLLFVFLWKRMDYLSEEALENISYSQENVLCIT